VDHLASSLDGVYHSDSLIFEELVYAVVRGNHEVVVLQGNRTSLKLSITRVSVHPNLEIVAEAISVYVL